MTPAPLPQLPDGLELTRTTDVFSPETAPAGLRRAHRVADGVWGRFVVRTGAATFAFEDDAEHPIAVGAGDSVAIPPGRLHHVEFDGPATFVVEFYRLPNTPTTVVEGDESTGLRD